jgi:sec-independent protein translocase protein TatA
MGTVGVQEMVLIFIVALVLFGPKKLPELGRTIGKAISEFRRATSDLKTSFEREMNNLERETEALKEKETQTKAIESAQNYASEYEYHDSYNPKAYTYTPPAESTDSAHTNSSTVSASEVPGAESHGTAEVTTQHEAVMHEANGTPAEEAAHGVEGTVPRVEATPQHS